MAMFFLLLHVALHLILALKMQAMSSSEVLLHKASATLRCLHRFPGYLIVNLFPVFKYAPSYEDVGE
jgi:hypothetical protein